MRIQCETAQQCTEIAQTQQEVVMAGVVVAVLFGVVLHYFQLQRQKGETES